MKRPKVKPKASKSKKGVAENKNTQYLVVTHFVDDTYENDIVAIEGENTIEDIAYFKLNKYNQIQINKESPEPKVREIDIFELSKIHKYSDLDILFNDNKKRFLENQAIEIKEEIAVE
jgi:hypothetical protein